MTKTVRHANLRAMDAEKTIPDFLNSHFKAKQKANPGYSIRAYARDLTLSPSFLSQVLSNQKQLSPAKAQAVSKRLHLNVDEQLYFVSKSIVSSSRSEKQKLDAQAVLRKIKIQRLAHSLGTEEFKVMSDWYHLGIFQTLFLKDYAKYCETDGEVAFLARFLKVPTANVKEALERLSQLKIIECGKKVHFPITDNLVVKNKIPSAAIRKFHRQMIEKSLVAMEAQPVTERFFNCTTLTLRQADLPDLMKEYETFYQSIVERFSKKASAKETADSVYALSSQLFRLSHGSDKK
jgi:uncharacterized protein (TIGR02147 family)